MEKYGQCSEIHYRENSINIRDSYIDNLVRDVIQTILDDISSITYLTNANFLIDVNEPETS